MKINNIVKYIRHILFIGFIIANIIINTYIPNSIIFIIYQILTLAYICLYIVDFISKTNDYLLNNIVVIFLYGYVYYLSHIINNINITGKYLEVNIIVISSGILMLIANQILNMIEKKNN